MWLCGDLLPVPQYTALSKLKEIHQDDLAIIAALILEGKTIYLHLKQYKVWTVNSILYSA